MHWWRNYGMIVVILSLVAASSSTLQSASIDLHVSPHGNDAWSGTVAEANAQRTDGPLATVAHAQQLVRALRAAQPDRKTPVTVAIHGGWYSLMASLVFAPEDSGTADSPTIYQAFNDERPILSGGVRITGWKIGDDGRWRVTLPEVAAGKWYFEQLFVNDVRRFRPRLPVEGFYQVAKQVAPTPAAKDRGADQFGFADGDLRQDWANLNDLEILAFHIWSTSRMRIQHLDVANGTAAFTGPTSGTVTYAFGFVPKGRYLVDNVREALEQPGQWYLDRPTGELTYLPLAEETPETTTIIAPRVDSLVEFAGEIAGERWVQHLQLHGLTFAYTNWQLPAEGQSFQQADYELPGTISAIGARDVAIDSCAVRHTGAYAVAFEKGCQNNRIENCELVDLGAGGIRIGNWGGVESIGPDDPQFHEPSGEVSHHVVRNCTIAHGGRLHPSAVGVWIGHASHNTIEHNDIFDLYYTGISVGWQWGYAASRAHDNLIKFNHIHTIGQGLLSDLAGVYLLGQSSGTVVANNNIHDINAFDYGGWGLYTDEGSSDIVMENNLVYRTKSGGFHQHYGRDNRVENNIFAFGKTQQIQRSRVEKHRSFTFERNIALWDNNTPLFANQWRDPGVKLDHNLYWCTAPELKTVEGLSFDQWQKETGQDKHSRVADPQFVDPANDDFRLKPESPATDLGFVPFDSKKAGRQTRAILTKDLPAVPAGFE